jgi:hypothetical protein
MIYNENYMAVTIGDIPVFNALITDEDTGMLKISLVDDPAVMSNFLAFDNVRKPLLYSVQNEEKRLVRGVVMRADFPIYRYDARFGEYYIIYKAEEIRKMAEKYLAESRQNDVNTMHQDGSDVDGVQMVQYFIKDSAAGVSPVGFDDIADGSLFAEFHIHNDEVWSAVKDGSYRGFSLEGVFDLVPETDEKKTERIADSLDGKFSKLIKEITMGKLNRFKAALLKAFAEFANITTDKGILAWDSDEDLKAGDAVFLEDAEGNRTPAEDGEYKTEDNKVIVVAEGKVAEIKDAEAEIEAPEAEPTEEVVAEEETPEAVAEEGGLKPFATDKGEILCEEIAEGAEVFVLDEEGNPVPAADDEYILEDGRAIEVAESKIAAIVEAAAVEEALKAEIAKLKKEISKLKKEIVELKKQPLAKSAHEEVVTAQRFERTGDKGLDKLAKVLGK